MDIEDVVSTVDAALTSDYNPSEDGFAIHALDLGEVFLRNEDGQVFRLAVEEIPAESIDELGIDFD